MARLRQHCLRPWWKIQIPRQLSKSEFLDGSPGIFIFNELFRWLYTSKFRKHFGVEKIWHPSPGQDGVTWIGFILLPETTKKTATKCMKEWLSHTGVRQSGMMITERAKNDFPDTRKGERATLSAWQSRLGDEVVRMWFHHTPQRMLSHFTEDSSQSGVQAE